MKKVIKLIVKTLIIVGILFIGFCFLGWLAYITLPSEPPWRTIHIEVQRELLYRISDDQIYFKSIKAKDSNNNGIGEYGTLNDFWDLFTMPPHNTISNTRIYFFAGLSRTLNATMYFRYYWKIFTPDDPSLAERYWCCYACPDEYPLTGKETYFINETCKIWRSKKEGTYGVNLNKTPGLADAYAGQPFTSAIDQTKWELVKDISKEDKPK